MSGPLQSAEVPKDVYKVMARFAFIRSGTIRARAMCCSFLRSAKTRPVQVQFSVVNGSGASSNTTSVKPHEFFDHTAALSLPPYYVAKKV